MLIPIQAPRLAGAPGIRHGFFTRQGGTSEGIYASLNCGLGSSDAQTCVLENRRRVADHLTATTDGVVTLYQEHGSHALRVDAPVDRAALPKADAIVTTKPGFAIGVLTADCAPVLFADAGARVVAAAHAGWRGAVGGILESAIAEMERAGASRTRIIAAVGPCINQGAYEVGPDFVRDVTGRDPSSEPFFSLESGTARPHFDLPGYVVARLKECGLAAVESAATCTYENESEFFSFRRTTHRAETDYGRQISAIVVT